MTNNFGIQSIAIVALLAISTQTRAADKGKVLFQNESRETISIVAGDDPDRIIIRQTRVDYHFQLVFPSEKRYVAKETITTELSDEVEGIIATAKVELFDLKSTTVKESTPFSTLEIPNVSQVKFRDDHWAASTFGCCDSEVYSRLYSYGGDKPFLRFNGGYAMAQVPNAKLTRYVGMVLRAQVPGDSAVDAIFGNNKKAIAAIAYAAAGKPLQQLLLEPDDNIPEAALPSHTLGVVLTSKSAKDEVGYQEDSDAPKVLTMWSLDPAPEKKTAPTAVSGLLITASFDGADGTTETVTIPVDNDKFGTPKFSGRVLRAAK